MLVPVNKIADSLPASLTEVTGAFRTIRLSLAELDGLGRAANTMQEELTAFLTDYYARVLPLTERLERLRYRKDHGVFPNHPLTLDHAIARLPREQNPLRLRKKALFRGLVKRSHPDNKQSTSTIDISEVYAAKTIGALWLLEIRCACDLMTSNKDIHFYLASQQAEIANALNDARSFNHLLSLDDMWQLKENVYEAALAGEDLIEEILCRIENQIAALQQYFVKPRISSVAA
jgi:hypothetical protein